MILHRIVELQAHTVIRKITDNQEEYEFIENLIESQKPPPLNTDHHYLIKTPFRYPLPVQPAYQGRFRPPFFHRNCFYGSETYRTSAYEYAYHWLMQRVHIYGLGQQPEPRTHFQVTFLDPDCLDLRNHPEIEKIMDRKNYAPSHRFIESNPDLTSILYPSCRDPERGNSIVTFEINTLGKQPLDERTLHFLYQTSEKKCLIQDPFLSEPPLEISWEEVF